MSAATVNPNVSTAKPPASGILRRFVWKEIRMLRGLWLAVLVLGGLIQWALVALSPPSADHAAILFTTALAAATLYAVGAAATIFSVEHEDETYDYLACLPATWGPIFIGKVSVSVASAMALACGLVVVGWLLAGREMPEESKAAVAAGLFGVAILEAVAWGTLFSLLIKRPLPAAIVTLVVGAAAVNLAVYLFAPYANANLDAVTYSGAAAARLAIVAFVLALSMIVARRWLVTGAAGRSLGARAWAWSRRPTLRIAERARRSHDRRQANGRSMLARLVWQSWRDGGKMLLLPFGVAAVLLLGVASVVTLTGSRGEIAAASWLATSLFVPALYGALAFSADQRRGSNRFLAEHAARPRLVWLARHVVWLGALLVLSTAIWLVVVSLTALGARFIAHLFVEEIVESGNIRYFGNDTPIVLGYFIDGASLTWCGILTAYGLGQLCSMLLRSEILAAFTALLLSMVITGWAAVLFAWQLSGWVFLLPLGVAFMLATWLRAPDWIAGRNSWQTWLKLALPVIAVLAFFAIAVPWARIAQIADDPKSTASRGSVVDLEQLVELHRQGDTAEARETAEIYLRAAESLDSPSAVPLAMKAAARPTCRFDFNVGQFADPRNDHPAYWKLDALLNKLRQGEVDPPFERMLAALRMNAHMRSGQASAVFLNRLENEYFILTQIGSWAANEQRTKEELKAALDQLSVHFRESPSLPEAFIADHLIVRDVLVDKEPSLVLAQMSVSLLEHLAWLANRLPWEQERAVLALDEITHQNVRDADELVKALSPNQFNTSLRKWIRPRYSPTWPATWMIAQPAAATSHFARMEYQARTDVHGLYRAYCDNHVYLQAAMLQLALVMYRRDKGAYPDRLSELVPDYLDSLPLDTYSRRPFQFEAGGLELPLRPFTPSNFTRID
ncbi:MAG TPA: hypothetical protein VJ809_08445, partial [Pirellulales bacterium]|nr:hypothetical protein [Pirellulales bacterium]